MKRHPKARPPRTPRLFAEAERPADQGQAAYIANIDGASRGNPGPASYAVLIRRPNGEVVDRLKKEIGQSTNNVAEYYALIAALDYAAAHRIPKLRIRSDSELLVRQMKGHYRVKSFALRQLHERARRLAAALDYFAIEHVPRELNREADALANAALDHASLSGDARSQEASERLRFGTETHKASPRHRDETRRIRARWRHGALHPVEPLELAEGEEVEITLHKLGRD
ncbi:MAG TPA: reverse transcriptase-like protein [Candidatus Acidoferrales bacterium]|jgi:probable phosphoglycerate mutase|nr:reverse transcriptase-like protein [Candidatus Acidoferrales bacterium]